MELLTAPVTQEEKDLACKLFGVSFVADKTIKAMRMIASGVSLDDTMRLALGLTNPDPQTKTNLRKKSEKWLLNSTRMQKLAGSAAERILQGKPIIGRYTHNGEQKENIIIPKASHIVAVIGEVTKRTEPVQGSGPRVTNNLFMTLDMSKYQKPQHIDRDGPCDIGSIDISNDIKELPED